LSAQEALDPQCAPERLADLAAEFPLEIAQNPSTPHAALRLIVRSNNAALLRCIAQNPNIPPDLAALLLQKFPYELVENPGWKMILLENPGFLEKNVSQFVISKMLDEQTLPEILVAQFAAHASPYIRKRVALYQGSVDNK
jgi:hypothetical protein